MKRFIFPLELANLCCLLLKPISNKISKELYRLKKKVRKVVNRVMLIIRE